MPVRQWADPHIGPGGRDGQRTDASQVVGAAHGLAVGSDVTKMFAAALAPDAGAVIVDVAQARRLGRFERIGEEAEFRAAYGFPEWTRSARAASSDGHWRPYLFRRSAFLSGWKAQPTGSKRDANYPSRSEVSRRPSACNCLNCASVRRMPSTKGVFGIGPRSRCKAESSRSYAMAICRSPCVTSSPAAGST